MQSPTPDARSPLRRRTRTTLAVLLAVAAAAVAVRATGLWPGEQAAGPQPAPRPVGAPVAVDGRAVTIVGAGDILPHPEVWAQARRDGGGRPDLGPMLAAVRPAVSAADLALCHLGVPLAPPGASNPGLGAVSAPAEVAQAIRTTGYDGCSTASQRSLDAGVEGVRRTLDGLDRAKLRHAGTHRSEEEAQRLTVYKVAGVSVAHLSYTQGFGTAKRPAGQEWIARLIDAERIAADAAEARDEGAEIVVVSVDWGTGFEHEPDVDQQKAARQIATIRDVDVVFGQNAHVVQPVERLGGKWIIYGMGDHISRHERPINENREGVIMRLTFTAAADEGRWKVAAIEALPTFIDLNPDIRVVDLERALADPSLAPGRRRIYEAAAERVKGHLLTRGAEASGLVVRGAAAR